MRYKNALAVLPDHLLQEVQSYIDGECLYIPRKSENKLSWGQNTNSRQLIKDRNNTIFASYMQGKSAKELAKNFNLSLKTIQKVLTAARRLHG